MDESNKDNNFKGINLIPILSGNCFLCIFSIIVNMIEIIIILSLKFLHSILYRLLFLIAINEIINCIFHIIQSLLIIFNLEINFIYFIDSLVIYFTDAFSIISLACLCDSMNTSILKQNKNLIDNQSYKFFSYIFSVVLTIIYFVLSVINYNEKQIYIELISWRFLSNINLKHIGFLSTNFMSFFITIIIYFLIILYSFFEIIKIQLFLKGNNIKEERSKNPIVVKEFKYKLMKYPLFGALWVLPLIIYSLFEYIKKNKNNTVSEISILRLKYVLYFIYTFISSIRGILFFKLFISNERIKKYIQDKIEGNIFFENVMKDKAYDILDYPRTDSSSSPKKKKKGSRLSSLEEGLIDDREDEKNKEDHNEEENSGNFENLSDDLSQSIKSMPENNNFQSISNIIESKKDIASDNARKK